MIAAIYARKSQAQHAVSEEAKSVPRQIENATAYATKKGWTVLPEYIFVDDGISGAEFERRRGLTALMQALKPRPPFQVLVVSYVDRLGREQIETTYLLKQIIVAGVRVFDYLEDRERVLDSPTDKLMLAVTTYAAEMERHQARLRTREKMLARARQGYVTGGNVFGYENVVVLKEGQKRDHVDRRINEGEATIVRRIFELAADGGLKRIAKRLNAEGVAAPRPRRPGRSRSWTASSLRGILMNPLYKGVMLWGRVRKRDAWGLKKYLEQPENEWVLVPVEHLRIVGDALWQRAHARLLARNAVYTRSGAKRLGGRPVGGVESPYLLTGFAVCALCGGGMVVGSRDMKRYRKPIYICAYHRERGSTVCPNGLIAPMDVANEAVRYAIMRDVLSIDILEVALEEALTTLKEPTDGRQSERRALQAELELVEVELAKYAEAVAKVGPVDALLAEISRREQRRRQIQKAIQALSSERHIASLDVARIWRDLARKLTDWQGLLARQAPEARGILRELLVGKLVFTPREDARGRYYEFTGQGTLSELLAGVICTDGLVTPAGFDSVWSVQVRGMAHRRKA